ncbi:hypothetical protein CERZMDRAFT_92486 [Cercospora zeae-maydis SCOH1-5]|uniref:Uncharacterized protein n=1 Tax=Cercospora zeae-maydis SCOH1-5 TaxID=717836 RepID=A0A6A6FWQ7_9PEZI|nr:hypothetical protein CERZMDRAFT_92486 [Cercospora zeae-maydis SCOH1-5]
MRILKPIWLSNAALLLSLVVTSPLPDMSNDLGNGAGEIEDAYHEASDGAKNAFDSTKHYFAGYPQQPPSHVAVGHQSCTATDNVFFISYSINIGSSYDAARCEVLKHKLKQAENVSHWQCVDDNSDGAVKNGRGLYRLWFNAGRNRGSGLSRALQEEFKEINAFNCPGCATASTTHSTPRYITNHSMSEVDAAATEPGCHGPLCFLVVIFLSSFCTKPLDWFYKMKQRRQENKFARMATSSPPLV